jgi:hypothetical protein
MRCGQPAPQGAALYEKMATKVLADGKHRPASIAPSPESLKKGELWTSAMRSEQIRRLREALVLERSALGLIAEALRSCPVLARSVSSVRVQSAPQTPNPKPCEALVQSVSSPQTLDPKPCAKRLSGPCPHPKPQTPNPRPGAKRSSPVRVMPVLR